MIEIEKIGDYKKTVDYNALNFLKEQLLSNPKMRNELFWNYINSDNKDLNLLIISHSNILSASIMNTPELKETLDRAGYPCFSYAISTKNERKTEKEFMDIIKLIDSQEVVYSSFIDGYGEKLVDSFVNRGCYPSPQNMNFLYNNVNLFIKKFEKHNKNDSDLQNRLGLLFQVKDEQFYKELSLIPVNSVSFPKKMIVECLQSSTYIPKEYIPKLYFKLTDNK